MYYSLQYQLYCPLFPSRPSGPVLLKHPLPLSGALFALTKITLMSPRGSLLLPKKCERTVTCVVCATSSLARPRLCMTRQYVRRSNRPRGLRNDHYRGGL